MILYLRSRALLSIGLILCLMLAWFAADYFQIPAYRGFSISLLDQPRQLQALMVACGALLVGTALASGIVGRVRAEAGLLCGCAGLAALRVRGGTAFDVLAGQSSDIYLRLGLELIALYAVVFIAWIALFKLQRRGLLAPERMVSKDKEADEPLDQRLLATVTTAATMAVGMMILCRSDAKAQVLAAVGISALLATMAAYAFVPTRPAAWYFAGPLLVGLLGYFWGLYDPSGLEIGQPKHFFAALARPLPLDYIAAGPAGAIIGYWLSRK